MRKGNTKRNAALSKRNDLMFCVYIVKIKTLPDRRILTKDMKYMDKKYGTGETRDNL